MTGAIDESAGGPDPDGGPGAGGDTESERDPEDGPDRGPASGLGLASRTAVDGDGTYWRDAEGIWRYRDGGDAVPGATDLRLEDLFDPPLEARDGEEVRVVPRAWASRRPDHPLAWVFEHAELGARGAIAVPATAWTEHATGVVAMAAPELHPHNLLGIDGVAALVGVTPATVRAYLARGQMPAPTGRIGGSPVWPRTVIDRWLPTRRRTASPVPDRATDPDADPPDADPPDEDPGPDDRAP